MNLSLLTTPSSGGTPPAFPTVRMMCLAELVFTLSSLLQTFVRASIILFFEIVVTSLGGAREDQDKRGFRPIGILYQEAKDRAHERQPPRIR